MDDRVMLHGPSLVLDNQLEEGGDGYLAGQRPQQVLPQIQPVKHEIRDGGILPDIPLHIDIIHC